MGLDEAVAAVLPRRSRHTPGPRLRVWGLAAWLLLLAPAGAHAQIFLASRPDPPFTVGPLFVRAMVTPGREEVPVHLLWSLVIPHTVSALDVEQDLFLLWPGAIAADGPAGPPDPALARAVEAQGLAVIGEGRAALVAHRHYQIETDAPPEVLPGGAPFVTFVGQGGALGLTAPATYLRIPWTPHLANRTFILDLRLTVRNLVKDKPATWFDRSFWGPRHRLALSFHDVRQRAMFPMYFAHRDQVIRLSDDPSQLMVAFASADTLKIEQMAPPSARRQRSETLDNTEVVSLYLDRSDGLAPQVLSMEFGYFAGLQAWAPVLIPILFFALGNAAGPVIRIAAEKATRALAARVHVGRDGRSSRDAGVILPRETIARIVPGETRAEDVLRLCGRDPEILESLATPERRTLVYRGRRVVPHRRLSLGWLATVDRWDLEQHEVEIVVERDVVRDIQARVRRSRLTAPEPN